MSYSSAILKVEPYTFQINFSNEVPLALVSSQGYHGVVGGVVLCWEEHSF